MWECKSGPHTPCIPCDCVRIVLGANCLGCELSCVRIVLGANCPGRELPCVHMLCQFPRGMLPWPTDVMIQSELIPLLQFANVQVDFNDSVAILVDRLLKPPRWHEIIYPHKHWNTSLGNLGVHSFLQHFSKWIEGYVLKNYSNYHLIHYRPKSILPYYFMRCPFNWLVSVLLKCIIVKIAHWSSELSLRPLRDTSSP